MDEIVVHFEGLAALSSQIAGIQRELYAAVSSLTEISNMLDWKIKSENQINSQLEQITADLNILADTARRHQVYLQDAEDKYARTEHLHVQNLNKLNPDTDYPGCSSGPSAEPGPPHSNHPFWVPAFPWNIPPHIAGHLFPSTAITNITPIVESVRDMSGKYHIYS